MSFKSWLLSNQDAAFEPLRELARTTGWAEGQETRADLLNDLRRKGAAEDVSRLETLFVTAWPAYEGTLARQVPVAAAGGVVVAEGRPSRWTAFFSAIGSYLGIFVISLISLLLLGAMFFAIFLKPDFLTLLAQADVARGPITFFFAIGTIGVAIAIAFMVLTSDVKDAEGRFPLAKDVLTILIGVLGTVIGYYFGIAKDEQVEELKIAMPLALPNELTAGTTFQIVSSIQGGKGPYTYSLAFDDGSLVGIPQTETESGLLIAHSFTLPDGFDKDTLPFEFKVRDLDGREKSFVQTLAVRKLNAGTSPDRTARSG